jgi:hypothetical protein
MSVVEAPLAAGARVRAALGAGRRWSVLLAVTAAVALAGVLRLVLGPGQVNYDSLYALVWGRDVARGHVPDYTANLVPPTPHPLSTMAGVLLAPLGSHADDALLVVFFLLLGVVGVLAFLLGRQLAGVAAGVIAAVLTLTRDTLLFNGALAYFDVAYLALLLAALLIELRRPRAGTPVLALLAVAGLWRPEAWVLAGAYALYLVWARRGTSRRWAPLALAAVGPAIWVLSDLIATGRPLYSLTSTQETSVAVGRATGAGAVFDLPRTLGQVVRPSLAVGALVGFGLALLLLRARALPALAMLVLSGAAIAVEVAGGTPGNPRYLLVPATLCVLLAAVALAGWREAPRGTPARRWWQAIAVVLALLVVAQAPSQWRRLSETRTRALAQHRMGTTALEAADRAHCRAPAVAGTHLVPLLALDHDVAPERFDVQTRVAPARGGYLAPLSHATVVQFLLHDEMASPPPGVPIVGAAGDWRVYGRCS